MPWVLILTFWFDGPPEYRLEVGWFTSYEVCRLAGLAISERLATDDPALSAVGFECHDQSQPA